MTQEASRFYSAGVTGPQLADDDVRALAAAARRVARARGADESTADDIAQETVTRLLAVTGRLERSALLPYALTTAGNLVVSVHRAADRAARHQHRLIDNAAPPDPPSAALALEEAAAVRSALQALDPPERQLFIAHAEGATTIDLAATDESTPAAIAARLARTRSRLRLDYLLAFRRVELPTITCRRVLLAVSAADIRRQQALGAATHLGGCPTCVALLPALTQRRSGLAGIAVAPLVALGRFGARLRYAARSHLVQATAGVTAVAVAAGIYAAAAGTRHRATPVVQPAVPAVHSLPHVAIPKQAPIRTAAGVALMPVPAPAALRAFVGQRIIVQDVLVQSVVSHPGFWIGFPGSQRLYVHLDHADLARQLVLTGAHVSFVGVLQANPAGFAATDGVATSQGATLLAAQSVHLAVDATKVHQD